MPLHQRFNQSYLCCLVIIVGLLILVVSVDLVAVRPDNYSELIRIGQVTQDVALEWVPVLTTGKVKTVNWFHKGLAQKFEIIFESGHVCSGKPILPEGWWGVTRYKRVDFDSLDVRQQKSFKRAEWQYQGWSEIVGYHVDKILGFHRKPPIVGRFISSKDLYANEPTWTGLWKRIAPAYDIPIAMVPWVDGLQRAIPSLDVRDYLIGNYTGRPSLKLRIQAGDASDKLVFDFLIDDHDTQGIQNWKADITGKLLHWDSGLGWRDGPYPRSICYEILCGTKMWKGVEHHDPNPATCEKICRFRESTVNMLMEFHNQTEPKQKLSYLLKQSLHDDPLYPVFNWAVWRFFNYNQDGARTSAQTVFSSVEEFLHGMDLRVDKLVSHIEECKENFGSSIYLTN